MFAESSPASICRRLPTVVLGALLLLTGCREWTPEPPPSVIFVTVDTLRPDRMSLYGYPKETTPELQRWLGGARAFTNAASSAPCTRPSVRQYLSGALDMQPVTLATALSLRGYQTAGFASQHQFHRRYEFYARGFETWDLQAKDDLDVHKMSTRTADDVVDAALTWLSSERDPARPLFLWVHVLDPHDPYNPPVATRRFAPKPGRFATGDRRTPQKKNKKPDQRWWYHVDEIFTDEDRVELHGLYDDEIRFVDTQLGRLFEALGAAGDLDGSMVVFSADHGERLGEDGIWDHCGSLHEREIRVPLVLQSPLPVETPSGARVSTLDIFPAVARVAGFSTSTLGLDGSDLHRVDPERVIVSTWGPEAAIAKGDRKLYCTIDKERCAPTRLVRVDSTLGETELGADAAEEFVSGLEPIPGLTLELVEDSERILEELKAIGYTE